MADEQLDEARRRWREMPPTQQVAYDVETALLGSRHWLYQTDDTKRDLLTLCGRYLNSQVPWVEVPRVPVDCADCIERVPFGH